MTAPTPTANITTDLHGVLHGTGIFEGQTLMVDGNKPIVQPFTGTETIICASDKKNFKT
jgi:hypothetical protein